MLELLIEVTIAAVWPVSQMAALVALGTLLRVDNGK